LDSVWTGTTRPAFFPVLSDADVDRIARRLAQILREEKS
jgi:predicted N-formylglutamate amidohydrolase